MIQPIYTSVSNAELKPCNNNLIKSEPIPLIKDKYLGEFRTELEKSKVRKNLGIADAASLLWGNIQGTIEEQEDLVKYVEQKWAYSNATVGDVNSVKEALDYALHFISQYESDTEAVQQLKTDIANVQTTISTLETQLTEKIDSNASDIKTISSQIETINSAITNINTAIETIDVDKNILNWVKNNIGKSLSYDTSLEVSVSKDTNNAVTIKDDGLYVEDKSGDIESLQQNQTTLTEAVTKNTSDIASIPTYYQTTLSDDTVSSNGTTVADLKGKAFSEIIDALVFPASVRNLVQPRLYYSFTTQIVEVGSATLTPTLTFVQNDAGAEISRTESVSGEYTTVGTYTHTGSVSYAAGEYLVNSRGETTDKRVEAGTLTAIATVIATYPWYSGTATQLVKQELIPFNQSSGDITISLTGKAVIKLPGANTQLNSFMVDGGLGYLNVDLSSWTTSTESLNGITYKVWTKNDEYSSILPHKINFTLNGI